MGIPRDKLNAKALAAVEAAERTGPPTIAWQMVLPYPPTVNTYYRNINGRTLISKRGREYRHVVASMVASSGNKPMAGRLKADIAVYLPDRRRRDLDNLLKGLMDSLQHGGAYKDDCQVRDYHIYDAGFDKPEGHVVVRLEAIE